MTEEKVYYRHEGEDSQKHLEGFTLNWATRGDSQVGVRVRSERGREERRERRPREEPGAKKQQENKEDV